MQFSIFFKKVFVLLLFFVALLTAGCAKAQNDTAPAAQSRFTDIDYWVSVFEDPKRDAWQMPDAVVSTMNLRKGDVVADIGAGTGYFTRRFAAAVGEDGAAIGLDIEQSMVEHMKQDADTLKLKNYQARVVKTDDPELGTKTVDVVFMCNTYHHIENRIAYLEGMQKSLKKGGRVVIVDFYKKELPEGPPPSHKLAKDIVLDEFNKAGYKLIRSHDSLPYQYFLEFAIHS